ncbi:YkvA family protein [Planctomycetota bacterium]
MAQRSTNLIHATFYEELHWRTTELLERVAGRLGRRFAELSLSLPDLVYLFSKVVADERISRTRRGELLASVVYVLSPLDIVPESLFGPIGLIDDTIVATRLLDTLLNGVRREIVDEHWPGDAKQLERLRSLAGETRKLFSLGLSIGLKSVGRRGATRAVSAVHKRTVERLRSFLG